MPAERTAVQSFWDFSLAFYAMPGVADACLALQDGCGADVNVLLFLLYRAHEGHMLSAAEVRHIETLAAPWRQAVVVPLRTLRRTLKAPVGAFQPEVTAALRTEVKRIELAAERVQQETLERLAALEAPDSAGADPTACARLHLQHYGDCIGALASNPTEHILTQFAALVRERSRSRP
jgi:uncharacterized protein (TIGR02444 family)